VLHTEFQGRAVPMILTHEGVVTTAKDWQHFSIDAPVRVPIPSEEDVRSVHQYPLEVDLPEHHDYIHGYDFLTVRLEARWTLQ
jgi:hypothetical protein